MAKIVTEIKCSMCGTTFAAEDLRKHYQRCLGRKWRRQRLKDGQLFIVSYAKLPVEGELRYDGYKVQCHICGRWYRYLPSHIRIHGLTADEYRKEFSLNRTQPLCSPEISDACAERLRQRGLIGKNKFQIGKRPLHPSFRKQGRMAISRSKLGKSPSLTPKNYQRQRRFIERLRFTVPCCICGKLTTGIRGGKLRRQSQTRNILCPECRPENKRRYMKEWYANHQGYLKEYKKQWYANHPGYNTQIERKRRRHLVLNNQRSEAER